MGGVSWVYLQKVEFWMVLLPYFFQPRWPSSGIPFLVSSPDFNSWNTTVTLVSFSSLSSLHASITTNIDHLPCGLCEHISRSTTQVSLSGTSRTPPPCFDIACHNGATTVACSRAGPKSENHHSRLFLCRSTYKVIIDSRRVQRR